MSASAAQGKNTRLAATAAVQFQTGPTAFKVRVERASLTPLALFACRVGGREPSSLLSLFRCPGQEHVTGGRRSIL